MTENQNAASRFYSPLLIGVATFFGAPIAGCILLAHNYRVLGKQRAARQCFVWGSISTVVLLIISYFLPETFPDMALPAGYTVGMYQAAKQFHGAEYASYIANGGASGSVLKAIGVGLACLFCIVVLIFLVAWFLPN